MSRKACVSSLAQVPPISPKSVKKVSKKSQAKPVGKSHQRELGRNAKDGTSVKMDRKCIHSRAWHQARNRGLREGMNQDDAKAHR